MLHCTCGSDARLQKAVCMMWLAVPEFLRNLAPHLGAVPEMSGGFAHRRP